MRGVVCLYQYEAAATYIASLRPVNFIHYGNNTSFSILPEVLPVWRMAAKIKRRVDDISLPY